MVFGSATLVVAGVACSTTTVPVGDAGSSTDSGGPVAPPYGSPPVDASTDSSGPVTLYGGPPVRDAGADAPSAAYGAPPVDAGGD